jgi:hypothetical protein
MKKLYLLGLVMGLMLVMPVVGAATKTTISGEGNFGYDFAAKDDPTNGDPKKESSSYVLKINAEVNPNVSLWGKFKMEPATKNSHFFADECFATLAYKPVTCKIGYYGFGFGGGKDILDVVDDFKSKVGLQAEAAIGGGLTGKVWLTGERNTDLGQPLGDGAYAAAIDFSTARFGVGCIYGDPDNDASGTLYTVNGFLIPFPDLKAYVNYCDQADAKKTTLLVGANYTPVKSPWEFRAEYDLDSESTDWTGDFNPWGIRVIYKINSNVKLQADVNEKKSGVDSQNIKLNITF